MLIIQAGTPDFVPMMAECALRAGRFGYSYTAGQLDASDDLAALSGVPPARFKPAAIVELSADVPEGQLFAWVDGDAIIVRELDGLVHRDFDVAVTLRHKDECGISGRPDTDDINSGVVFFRQNHRTRAFLKAWGFACRWFSGDQHALSAIVRELSNLGPKDLTRFYDSLLPIDGLKVLVLPAPEWNCWHFDLPLVKWARILHFKSGFRKANGPAWWQSELRRIAG